MKTRQELEADRRVKELDVREAFLKEWEAFLKSAPISIIVLKQSLIAKKDQLAQIDLKLGAANEAYADRVLVIRGELNNYGEKIDEAKSQLEGIQVKQSQINTENISLRAKGKELKADISEARKYKTEQQQLLEESIEEGNTTLKALKYELDGLEEKKKAINYEIAILNKDLDKLETMIAGVRHEYTKLQENYNETRAKLDKSLDEMMHKVKKAEDRYTDVDQQTTHKLQVLQQKEEEITAKRDALHREHQELETDKRRWNSVKALYDV